MKLSSIRPRSPHLACLLSRIERPFPTSIDNAISSSWKVGDGIGENWVKPLLHRDYEKEMVISPQFQKRPQGKSVHIVLPFLVEN